MVAFRPNDMEMGRDADVETALAVAHMGQLDTEVAVLTGTEF